MESWGLGRDENGWVVKPPGGKEAKVESEANSVSQGAKKRKPGTSAKAISLVPRSEGRKVYKLLKLGRVDLLIGH